MQRQPGHYIDPSRDSFPLNPGEHHTRDLTLIVETKPDGSRAIKEFSNWVDIPTWPPTVAWSLDAVSDRLTGWTGAVYLDVPVQ